MRKLRILALMHDVLVPPKNFEDFDLATVDWKMEFDITITLRDIGHDVFCMGVDNKLDQVREKIVTWQPHIVFNMVEDFYNIPTFDSNFVAFLELMRVPYTGCNPRGLLLGRDKALSKKVLNYHGVPVPHFTVFPDKQKVRPDASLSYPMIVKAQVKEASAGLSQASVVGDADELIRRVDFMHERIGGDVVAEQYIEGRELYVGIVGNQRLQVFPVWEMLFTNWPSNQHKIATGKVKFSPKYQKKRGIKTARAEDIPLSLTRKIQRACADAYKALELSGYARIDVRLQPDGKFYILEANPNPQLAFGEDFAESAEYEGLSYEALLQKILNLGLAYQPDHRG